MSKVLVVAFDGMDKDLIDEFNLENIPQEEFGGIDNDSGITSRVTSELFASFITGETHGKHGIKGLTTVSSRKKTLSDILVPGFMVRNVPGFRRIKHAFNALLDTKGRKYRKEDLRVQTLFDKIDASKPLYVPSYNPEFLWSIGYPVSGMEKEYSVQKIAEEARYDTSRRLFDGTANQEALFELSKGFWDFVMIHLHDPDTLQDIGIRGEELREDYERLDAIAGDIIQEFGGEFDIIFMSDHGMIEDKGESWEHNKNAFYSSSRPLFSEETPHIKDFHDRILDLVDG